MRFVVATTNVRSRLSYFDEVLCRRHAPAQTEIDSFLDHAVHADAVDTHGWLDWIVMDHLTIDFCEKKRARKGLWDLHTVSTALKELDARKRQRRQGAVTL
jgi:hypothetical protein